MTEQIQSEAPGAPGTAPRWTSSSKDGIGMAINAASHVRFTLSHGILNEIYFPREDKAAIRDMGLIVTNGRDFFSEEKRHTHSTIRQVAPGVPAFEIINTCVEKRYQLVKQIIADPLRHVVLQRIEFKPEKNDDYHLYGLLAPHLSNQGMGNSAIVAEYKGHLMLFARNGDVALAFACSVPWKNRSVGYVGTSDGWQDLHQHHVMTWSFQNAPDGNVALLGEVDLESAENNVFDITIGFGTTEAEAAQHAMSSLMEGFNRIKKKYIDEWQRWQEQVEPFHESLNDAGNLFLLSASVLRIHQSKMFPGAMVASLSIPWGETQGDDDESGYHLVWPRDLVECAGGLLAIGAREDVLRVVNYLMSTQEADGHWSQNMWLEGAPYWEGIQLDETALPILLIDLCLKHNVLDEGHVHIYWNAVRRATTFLISQGLVTQQDRWEEQDGISVFTIATSIAALLASADLAQKVGEADMARYCRQTADAWNDSIETWLYASHTRLAEETGVEGYYLRLNPAKIPASRLRDATMQIKNKPDGENSMPVTEMISVDPLALVRFGLRAPDDPRILNTLAVIDAKLKTETPNGPCWYRYRNDGYGEHADGSAFDGIGIGRPWPLLTGERAHYEVAAGNIKTAYELLHAMENFSNNGLLAEQIWDQDDIPDKGLFHGRHTGSAMPLVWAHAEHLKLVCSIKDQAVFDMPRHTQQRYIRDHVTSNRIIWRARLPVDELPSGKLLRIETHSPANVQWTIDQWGKVESHPTEDTGLGVHFVDLPTESLNKAELRFRFTDTEDEDLSGVEFLVNII